MATKESDTSVLTSVLTGAQPSPSFQAPEEPHWHRIIAETAYFIAEQRGFEGNSALADWLEAEQRVKDRLQNRPQPLIGQSR
ncbi:MAG: DUF2934 domain-containing protein [Pseudomonadota bacterium]|nr:DUF2934 domain-containing protein [Pseudomonadota bacterium]